MANNQKHKTKNIKLKQNKQQQTAKNIPNKQTKPNTLKIYKNINKKQQQTQI